MRGETHRAVDTAEQILGAVRELAKKGLEIQRYKGLGEMNPSQLRETTMLPDTRRLVQLTFNGKKSIIETMDMLLAKKRSRSFFSSLRKTYLGLNTLIAMGFFGSSFD